MTELHYALIAAALLLLVALFGWSKWQERRQMRRLREPLDGPRHSQPPRTPPAGERGGRIEPRLGDLPGEAPAPAGEAETSHSRSQLATWTEDPMLDCVLELRCAHAVDGVAVIDATASLLRLDCGLPVHVAAWDGRAEHWVHPDRFGFYGELLAAIQLATRRSRLGEIEVSKFIATVQQVAVALDADFDPPELPLIRRRVEQLEALIAQFDVQIGLTVQSAEAVLNPNEVARAVQAVGLTPGGDMRWSRSGEDGQALFSARLTPGHSLLLELDVPVVAPDLRPLQSMFAAAAELAVLLNARVVDDHGRPLVPGSIEAIDPALQALYAKMRAADIEPGSERSRRLFS
jgi:hypothetical protein